LPAMLIARICVVPNPRKSIICDRYLRGDSQVGVGMLMSRSASRPRHVSVRSRLTVSTAGCGVFDRRRRPHRALRGVASPTSNRAPGAKTEYSVLPATSSLLQSHAGAAPWWIAAHATELRGGRRHAAPEERTRNDDARRERRSHRRRSIGMILGLPCGRASGTTAAPVIAVSDIEPDRQDLHFEDVWDAASKIGPVRMWPPGPRPSRLVNASIVLKVSMSPRPRRHCRPAGVSSRPSTSTTSPEAMRRTGVVSP
jgi:hypothetical protein